MVSLPRRKLGSTGLEVAALGLGGAWIGRPAPDVTDDQAVETVRCAIDAGIDYVDTSPLYGESERRIGLALEGGYRDRVVLATKTGTRAERQYDFSGDATRWSIELSLKLLRTDHLDVVLIHDPPAAEPAFAKGAALDTLEALREEGVLRFIGMGVREHDILEACVASGRFDLILTYLDFNLVSQTAMERLIPSAREKGMAVVNASPLYMGLLIGEDPNELARRRGDSIGGRRLEAWELERSTKVWRWAEGRGIDLVALALQYSLAEPRIAVTLNGARSPQEIRHSLECATLPLPENVWQELERECGVTRPGAD